MVRQLPTNADPRFLAGVRLYLLRRGTGDSWWASQFRY